MKVFVILLSKFRVSTSTLFLSTFSALVPFSNLSLIFAFAYVKAHYPFRDEIGTQFVPQAVVFS